MISGFHRSGTSLTAQYLHRAGLNLGDNLLGANPSNPDGHFEDQDIVALHKDILAANRRDWYTPGPDLSTSASAFQGQAQVLLRKFAPDESMGFKDPRSSLLLPWWHQQLDNPAAIIIFRHFSDCFHSLRNRQAQNLVFAPSQHKDALFFWQQPTLALELWLSYNEAILDYVKSHRESTLLVSHHAMLNGFDLPSAVNQTFGLTLNTRCDSGIRPGRSQHQETLEAVESNLRDRLEAMLASLNTLCCSAPEPSGDADRHHSGVVHNKATVITQRELIEQHLDALSISDSANQTGPDTQQRRQTAAASTTRVVGLAEQNDDIKELIAWGKQHQARANSTEAEACWNKAHQLAPTNVAPLLHLALLARDQSQDAKAAQLMQTVLHLKPDNAGYHLHLARALNGCAQPEQALDIVRLGLNLQQDHRDLHYLQLELLITLHDHREARNACNRALLSFPNDARFMKIMVRLAGENADSKTAMTWFRRSVLTRIREKDDYRRTLLQALEQVPDDQQPALSNRVIEELKKLNADAGPGRVAEGLHPQTVRTKGGEPWPEPTRGENGPG